MTEPHKDNDRIVALRSAEAIEDEAADWLIALSRDDVSEQDILEFRAWERQCARNREAFERMAALWDDLSVLKVLDDYAESASASISPGSFTLNRRALTAIAASVGIVLTVGAAQYISWASGQIQEEQFATAVGEQRTIRLSDGSEINLNTDTEVQVAYTRRQRNVTLVKGEAHFTVAQSKRRPYLVYAGDGLVRAVGTAFTVHLRPDAAVEVTVEEGRVALSPSLVVNRSTGASDAAPDTRELIAGANVVYGERVQQMTQLPPAEISRKLAWRQGVLAYAGEPLSEVVADISRYTPLTIEIADPDLQTLQIGGYFKIGEVDEMFESLELNFGLSVERVSDAHVRITGNS